MAERKTIKISNLLINPENPRYDYPAENQREAIKHMVDEQKGRIVKLATDIVDFGLNPLEQICVSPTDEDDIYKVLEGNRRITALKLIHNPDILSSAEYSALNKQFKQLAIKADLTAIEELECIVFENETEAEKWIELKHTGPNDGKGTVEWENKQKDYFNERVKGKTSIALQVIRHLKDNEHVDTEVKKNADKISGTTLTRIIGSSPIQDVLGITLNNGIIETNLPAEEFAKGVSKIAKDLLEGKETSRTLDKSEQRQKYAESIRQNTGIDYSKRQPSKLPIRDITTLLSTNSAPQTGAPPPQASSSSSRLGVSSVTISDRKVLIPRNTKLAIPANSARVQLIFKELKTLNIDTYPNAVGVLFRVFIELSVDSYVQANLSSINTNDSLMKKVDETCKDMISKSILTKYEVKPIQTAISTPHSLFSMNTFNAYVHNPNMTPKKVDMIHTWNDFGIFLQKLWQNI
jgi:hypothetical protein